MTQHGSIERCQICGFKLSKRDIDGFTCDHCLEKMIRNYEDKARRPKEDKGIRA